MAERRNRHLEKRNLLLRRGDLVAVVVAVAVVVVVVVVVIALVFNFLFEKIFFLSLAFQKIVF